jgi:heme-degrading monooxygenase HmoA
MGEQYVSGDWTVRGGQEEEFMARWLEFTGWSLENAPGAESFVLLRDKNDPVHFVSLGSWASADSIGAWRTSDRFAELLERCKELCEEFQARDYSLAASPSRTG